MKKRTSVLKRCLTLVLAVILLVTSVPLSALGSAPDTGEETRIPEESGQTTEQKADTSPADVSPADTAAPEAKTSAAETGTPTASPTAAPAAEPTAAPAEPIDWTDKTEQFRLSLNAAVFTEKGKAEQRIDKTDAGLDLQKLPVENLESLKLEIGFSFPSDGAKAAEKDTFRIKLPDKLLKAADTAEPVSVKKDGAVIGAYTVRDNTLTYTFAKEIQEQTKQTGILPVPFTLDKEGLKTDGSTAVSFTLQKNTEVKITLPAAKAPQTDEPDNKEETEKNDKPDPTVTEGETGKIDPTAEAGKTEETEKKDGTGKTDETVKPDPTIEAGKTEETEKKDDTGKTDETVKPDPTIEAGKTDETEKKDDTGKTDATATPTPEASVTEEAQKENALKEGETPAENDTQTVPENALGAAAYANPTQAKIQVNWVDNHSAARPADSLETAGALYIEYTIDGKLKKLDAEAAKALGITVPSDGKWITGKSSGDTTTYTSVDLPSKVKVDGVEKEISYKIKSEGKSLLTKGYIAVEKNDKTYFIKTTTFTGTISVRDGGTTKKADEVKALVEEALKESVQQKASYYDGTGTADIPWEKDDPYFVMASGIVITASSEGVYTFAYTGIPEFTVDQQEITYSLTGNTPFPAIKKDTYVPSYDNRNSANHGTDEASCYNNGELILTLTGETIYTATKNWLDPAETEWDARLGSKPKLVLWRYTGRDDNNYTKASQVFNEGNPVEVKITQANSNDINGGETGKTIHIIDETNEDLKLPKYDADGYPYVYFMREESLPKGYEQVHGAVDPESGIVTDQLPDGMTKRADDDRSVYNGGTISNRITENVEISQKKTWKAAAEQNSLGKIKVELRLQSRPEGSTDAAWTDVKEDGELVTETLDGFISETLTKSITVNHSKYDYLGRPSEYRLVENRIIDTGKAKDEQEITLTPAATDEHPERQTFSLEDDGETCRYESQTEKINEEDVLVNRLIGTTRYTVEKEWKDENGAIITDADRVKDLSITVNLLQDGKPCGEEKTLSKADNWIYSFENLPKYDDNGRLYTYHAMEGDLPGWDTTVTYEPEGKTIEIQVDGKAETVPLNMLITNRPPGKGNYIEAEKVWKDDADLEHRGTVHASLQAKTNIWTFEVEQATDGKLSLKDDKIQGYNSDVKVMGFDLTASMGWYNKIGVPYAVEKQGSEDETVAKARIEKMLEDGKLSGDVLSNFGAYKMLEVSVDKPGSETQAAVTQTDTMGANRETASPKADGYLNTGEHYYDVTYSKGGGLHGDNCFVITNRRIGSVNITVEKIWADAKNNGDKTKRPKATLNLISTDKTVIFDGTGYTLVKDDKGEVVEKRQIKAAALDAGGEIQYDDNGQPKMTDITETRGDSENGQTVTVSTGTESNVSAYYTFFNLPKYDADGAVIHYAVTETMSAEDTDYASSQMGSDYKIRDNAAHTVDIQKIELKNFLTGTKDVKFKKLWIDAYNKEVRGNRPDIYMTLYSDEVVSAEPSSADAAGSEGKEAAKITKIEKYKNRTWKETSRYEAVVTFPDLPKYDDKGNEITYYAKENFRLDPKTYDYIAPDFGEKTTTAEHEKDGTVFAEVQYTADADGNLAEVAGSGTIINRIQSDLKISGRKIWKAETGNTFPSDVADVDFPEITINLYRNMKTQESSVADPKYTKDAAFNALGVSTTLSKMKRVPGTNEFQFQLENYTDGKGNTVPLQKYDDNAWPYQYYIEETKMEDMPYVDPTVNNYEITNKYKTDLGSITVNKTWDRTGLADAKGKPYPAATFVLYSQYKTKVTEAGKFEKIGDAHYTLKKEERRITLNAKDIKDNKGAVAFGNLPVLAVNGEKYRYTIAEVPVDGYEVDSTLDTNGGTWAINADKAMYFYSLPLEPKEESTAVEKVLSFFAGEKAVLSDVAITNKYKTERKTVSLTGTKAWDDYGNAFTTRPEEITLSVVRYADTQPGQNNAVGRETVTTQSGKADDPYYLTWAKNDNIWTYTIANMERYASNSMPWKYEITEKELPEGYADPGKVGQASVDTANGNITMKKLTNTLNEKAALTKVWAGDNKKLRPASITVKLQVSTGGETWTDALTTFAEEIKTIKAAGGSFATEKEIANAGQTGNWSVSFEKLPAGKYGGDGAWTDYHYRIIETKIGETTVTFNSTNSTYAEAGAYTPAQGETSNGTTTITNTLTTSIKSLTVEKTWKDQNNQYNTRPESITFTLQSKLEEADDNTYTDVVDEGNANKPVVTLVMKAPAAPEAEWTVFITDLPGADKDGKELTYRAVEKAVPGYTATSNVVETPSTTGAKEKTPAESTEITVNVQNALDPTVNVTAKKIWLDENATPEANVQKPIVLELLHDGQPFKPAVTISWDGTATGAFENGTSIAKQEDGSWLATWAGVPKYSYAGGTEKAIAYTVRETSVPDGYYESHVDAALTDANTLVTTVTNRRTSFSLNKVAAENTDQALNGAVFEIRDAENAKAAMWRRDEEGATYVQVGTELEAKMDKVVGLPVGSYTLVETDAPTGYLTAPEIPFKIKDDGTLELADNASPASIASDTDGNLTITVTDERILGHVKLTKYLGTEAAGNKLAGVTFDLYRQVGEAVAAGDIKIAKELKTDANGVWTSAGNTDENYVLEGIDKAGAATKMFSTGLPSGTYYFKETTATPDSKLDTDTPHLFAIVDSGITQPNEAAAAVAVNQVFAATVEAKKYDAGAKVTKDGHAGIAGVPFSLSYKAPDADADAEWKELPDITTDGNGLLELKGLIKGQYKLTEKTPPTGYTSSFSCTFTIKEEDFGKKIQLNSADFATVETGTLDAEGIPNQRILGSARLKKVDAADLAKVINDAEFDLVSVGADGVETTLMSGLKTGKTYQYGNSDTVTETTGEGVLTITDLPWDVTYKFAETKPADGYLLPAAGIESETFTFSSASEKSVSLQKDGADFVNEQNTVTIKKADIDKPTTALQGAVYTVTPYDTAGELQADRAITTAATDAEGTILLTGKLIGGVKYQLAEDAAPAGYESTETTADFTMGMDGVIKDAAVHTPEGDSGSAEQVGTENTILFKNRKIEGALVKTNADGTTLADAEFKITGVFKGETSQKTIIITSGTPEAKALIENLLAEHDYVLEETKAPDGHVRRADSVTIHVDGKGKLTFKLGNIEEDKITSGETLDTLKIYNEKIALRFEQQDQDGKEITTAPGKFKITGDAFAGTAETEITFSNNLDAVAGKLIASDKSKKHVYAISEVTPPNGYASTDEVIYFIVNDKGEYKITDKDGQESGEWGNHTLTMRDTILEIGSLHKRDLADKGNLDAPDIDTEHWGDAAFSVAGTFASADSPIIIKTGEHGLDAARGQLIEGNTYTVTETIAPSGYSYAGAFEFTVEKSGFFKLAEEKGYENFAEIVENTIRVYDRRSTGNIAFSKYGKYNESCSDVLLGAPDPQAVKALDGVEFTLYFDAECTRPIKKAESKRGGKVTFYGLPEGTYYVKETKAIEPYQPDPTVYQAAISRQGSFSGLEVDGTPVERDMVINDIYRTSIVLKKVSEQKQDTPIANSVYGLYRKADAPDAAAVSFAGAGTASPAKTGEMKMLSGLSVLTEAINRAEGDENMQLIAKAVTGKDGILRFEGVRTGVEYVIRELEAPDGSQVSKNPVRITFKVDEDGTVKVASFEDGSGTAKVDPITGEILWLEPQTMIRILKKDQDGKLLAGADLQITGKDGKATEKWTSDGKGHLITGALTAGEEYYLEEVSAPEGYKLAERVPFTVEKKLVGPGENFIQEVEMINALAATPTVTPSVSPTETPSVSPSVPPTETPSVSPTETPSVSPTETPSVSPSVPPSGTPSVSPTGTPSVSPSGTPSVSPSVPPSGTPSVSPSVIPTNRPGTSSTPIPTRKITPRPTRKVTPTKKVTPTPKKTTVKKTTSPTKSTKTGDNAPIFLFAALFLAAGTAVVLLIRRKRKSS